MLLANLDSTIAYALSKCQSGSTYRYSKISCILLLTPHRWYKNITPRTRLIIGVGVMAYAGAGLFPLGQSRGKIRLGADRGR